jgi:DNA repair protein RadD
MKTPRYYQVKIDDKLFNYLDSKEGNPLLAIPCGAGKSLSQAIAIKRLFERNNSYRFLAVCHVKEIIKQNAEELSECSNLQPSIYCAGLNKSEIGQFNFASVASIAKKSLLFGHIDWLFMDEAHSLSETDNSMYMQLINGLLEINPVMRIIGYSATPFRLGLGYITDGKVFDDIIVNATYMEAFNWFIESGYLVNMISKQTLAQIDISDVKKRGGDYIQSDLQKAVDKEEVTRAALTESMRYAANRHHWIVFASGVNHAEHITQMLIEEFGISAVVVHSKMSDEQRDKNIDDFKAGKYRAIVNNLVLTIGSNLPLIDMVIDLAPTSSPARMIQKYGRASRPVYAKGFDLSTKQGRLDAIATSPKKNALVLDFGQNIFNCGMVNNPKIPRKKGSSGGESPVKICPECLTAHHTSRRICDTWNDLTGKLCEFEFTFKSKLTDSASSDRIIDAPQDPIYQNFEVVSITYALKKSKKDKIPMLRVTYKCAFNKFDEYICLEHTGFAYTNARRWWRNRTDVEPPATVDEALLLCDNLIVPLEITVIVNQKYPKITDYLFDSDDNKE